MSIIPNVPPKAFSFSAVIVGYLLIDDTTANEQNALGNWLMLVAQVLSTNAYYQQVQTERGNNPKTAKPYNNTNNFQENRYNEEDEIKMLQKMVAALNKEIENLKNINQKF